MFEELLACLDGSLFAERILPYAHALARLIQRKFTLLRVVESEAEFAAAENYLRGCARRWQAEVVVKRSQGDVAGAILEELQQRPHALPAITTHGRSGLLEALLGSVALSLIRSAQRPVLLYRPQGPAAAEEKEREVKIGSVVVPLDGSEFSERVLPFAAETAKILKAELELVQVLPASGREPHMLGEMRGDVIESSYLHNQAEVIRRKCALTAGWEVLHGDPGEAICRHVRGRHDVILAMTCHARAGLEQAIFGSVTSECVRRSGVVLLVYQPSPPAGEGALTRH